MSILPVIPVLFATAITTYATVHSAETSFQWVLEIEPISYLNSNSYRWNYGDGILCCDGDMDSDGICQSSSKHCESYFHLCLVGTNGNIICRLLDAAILGDDIDFSLLQLNDENIILPFTSNETEQLNISIIIMDLDSNHENDFIDKIIIVTQFNGTVSSEPPMTYLGNSSIANMTLAYKFRCADGYFGSDCSLYCVNFDSDINGHFLCDENGNKVCRQGYQDPSSNCIEQVVKTNVPTDISDLPYPVTTSTHIITTSPDSSQAVECNYSVPVLLSVCVSGALSSVVTVLIGIAVFLVINKRGKKKQPTKATTITATPPPIYDTVTETSGKESIELNGNVAYAHTYI